jgi:hypothetical protein
MNLTKYLFYTGCALLLTASGCQKESVEPGPDIFFSLERSGNTIQFKNQTTGATTYKWDLGDGSTSTEESPTHTYPGKGKYVVTLYATTGSGQTVEGSTVLRIDKTSPVKLDDNTLDDWTEVTQNVAEAGVGGGIFKKAKYDYDSENIYIYLEMSTPFSPETIFDFYLDTDNDATTGLLTGYFPNGGYDVLLEGALLTGWFDVFYHKGGQTDFSFDVQSISEFFTVGHQTTANGRYQFEMKLSRAKLKGLSGKGMRIGITATSSDWAIEYGTSPDKTTSGFFLNLDE